jgi:pyruvate formate lyase activating enzyme
VDHELCNGCGLCIPVCPSGAMRLFGETMNLSEVMREVKKDLVFYRRSGGGVTLSGGEVAMQPGFASAILNSSRELGIHTAIETSGYAPWPSLEKIVRHCDLVLFDLKAMDTMRHRDLTGKDNALILENARAIAGLGRPMIIRMPLIPGCNDTEQNIHDTARFIKEQLPGVNQAHLLPYEMFGEAKYQKLGWDYQLGGLRPPDPDAVQQLADILAGHGLEVSIRG